jgi:EAL domain-containing protein (putative c-di-GMP-specific phosphodiesterase class I)
LLSKPYALDTLEYACTASLGVTLIRGDGSSADDMLKQADIAMYQAKAAGRNAFRFYSAYMQDAIQSRALLEQELHVAAGLNQFVLHYQQQIDGNDAVVGAEALIRWNHPTRGTVVPDQFIPFAEETGLITEIGTWVIENACAQLNRWARDSHMAHLTLSLNVSAHQFRQATFVSTVLQAMHRHAVNPARLMLEITESVMLDNIDASITKMDELVAAGVRFALDDFGTGHSSLSYLTRLPISQLKIAQPFIDNIGTNASDAVVIQTIVGMAKNLGLEVIAEGVETQSQRDYLAAHGCQLCQGFLFSRPLPVAEFHASLAERATSPWAN